MGSRGPMISTLATLRYRGVHFGRIYGLISIGMGLGGFSAPGSAACCTIGPAATPAVMILRRRRSCLAAASLGSEAGARERLSR